MTIMLIPVLRTPLASSLPDRRSLGPDKPRSKIRSRPVDPARSLNPVGVLWRTPPRVQ